MTESKKGVGGFEYSNMEENNMHGDMPPHPYVHGRMHWIYSRENTCYIG